MSRMEFAAGKILASSEGGPLLSNSERISGWLDSASGGAHRFSVTWTLPPTSGPPAP